MICFYNVNKSYDKKLVLQDINLSLDKGHCVGLVGPNGSGKSTLLRMISGVIEPDAGIIEVFGKDVFNNPDVKRRIFFLGDDPYFFNQSTMVDMRQFYKLFYPLFDDRMFMELANDFGLDVHAKINSFSKGMKRQISLILALASRPEILLLDEAFDGLDPIMRFKLRQHIANEISERNILVIISSHNLRELEDICDSIALINNYTVQFSHSTQEVYDLYHKFQVVFNEDMTTEDFSELHPLHVSGQTRIFTFIIKGEREMIQKQINTLNPLLSEYSTVSLEEIFVYEVEGSRHEKTA